MPTCETAIVEQDSQLPKQASAGGRGFNSRPRARTPAPAPAEAPRAPPTAADTLARDGLQYVVTSTGRGLGLASNGSSNPWALFGDDALQALHHLRVCIPTLREIYSYPCLVTLYPPLGYP
jgi:hypothetical protein